MWSTPTVVFPHGNLRRPQGRRRRQTILQHAAIEPGHKLRGGPVVDAPKAGDHPRRAGVHESARQSDQSLALDLFAQRRLASAQDYEVGVQSQIVNLIKAQKTILWLTVLIHQ